MIDDVEQFRDILFIDAGEGNSQVGLADGDTADTVLVEEVDTQFLGIHGFEFQAHEVAGVERVVIPGVFKLAAVEDLLGLEGAPFEDLELLFLLLQGSRVNGAPRWQRSGKGGGSWRSWHG